MFTNLKNRIAAAESIESALKYLRDDATNSMEMYGYNTDEWSKEQYAQYEEIKNALDIIDEALVKFVKSAK